MNNTNELKFFWNGIKAKGGKLERVSYFGGELRNHPKGTITIYTKSHSRFSDTIQTAFVIQNDSDGQTDYFEKDRIRVSPSHPLYPEVAKALAASDAHYDKRLCRLICNLKQKGTNNNATI